MATKLETTVYREISIGSKRFVLGLHPQDPEAIISIRPVGKRVPYAVPVSTIRVHAALAFGRAEKDAKREAQKSGVPWKRARKKFFANLLPPDRKRQRKEKHEAA